jgi:signal transduction histidine kinase
MQGELPGMWRHLLIVPPPVSGIHHKPSYRLTAPDSHINGGISSNGGGRPVSSCEASDHDPSKPKLGHDEFRRIRHSVGDFLQFVYLTEAMLRSRLPQSAVEEQNLINQLKLRAEVCKSLVDNVQDYLCRSAIAPEPVSLSEICTSLIAEFRLRFPAVDWKFEGDSSVLVQADREALIACGRQLMANAVQAGASHVTIQLRVDADSTIHWDIVDDGSGIEESDATKLFEPFTGNRSGQAGLGLTIVARTVGAMNGGVTLSNRKCGGAQASISLPAKG